MHYVCYSHLEYFELGGVSFPYWVVSRPCQDPISLKLMAAASILLEQLVSGHLILRGTFVPSSLLSTGKLI